jgi:pimeloyl-ACP methyl ester carboxylesterase
MDLRPFRIDVPDPVLADLRERLARTRWPEPIPGAEWDYGAKVDTLRELCAYWRDGYDWRAQEAQLNEIPGFMHEVDGVDLHFWHVRSSAPDAFPLLLLHGWPGSIYEFHHVLGPLSDQFDLVVPALPGFGFGGRPRERGWGPTRIAAAFDTLMSVLGYERYGVQGGDWGAILAAKLGAAHPARVAAIHVNYLIAPPPPDAGPEHAAVVEQYGHWRTYEDAYSRLQRTKPDSLTLAQSDSPAGLAAWIVEKFRAWSDCDGDVVGYFGRDTLLTNLMFYWAPGSVESAARIYYESARDPAGREQRGRVEVPVAYAAFPHEIISPPREWAETHYAIERWTEMPRGGHFAALEAPDLLVDDVRSFFASVARA